MEKTQTQKTTQGFQLASQFYFFFEVADKFRLTGIEQLLYLHLMKLVNKSYKHSKAKVSDAELIQQMNLRVRNNKTISSIALTRARKHLEKLGLIIVKRGTSCRETSEYKLLPLSLEILKAVESDCSEFI